MLIQYLSVPGEMVLVIAQTRSSAQALLVMTLNGYYFRLF